MHGTVLNSLALKKYGISAATPTPPGGVIVRKPGTQEPWGLIMETAFLPIIEKSEPLTAQKEIDWTRAGQLLYAENGVTTAHEGASHLPQIQTMMRASEAGANIIDVVAFPFITDLDRVLGEIPLTEWGRYKKRFKIGGVKITLTDRLKGARLSSRPPTLPVALAGKRNGEVSDFSARSRQPHGEKGLRTQCSLDHPLQWRCRHRRFFDRLRVRSIW